ncbi:MAG TPA: hypothetical protein VGI16_01930 [Candidatus Acidoferrum sp.]
MVAFPARADEIRLKDGKKLYGVIVAYEDNMFKVKTDYGFVLVEKDKIASIVPAAPAAAAAKTPPDKKDPRPVTTQPAKSDPKAGGSEDAENPAVEPIASTVKENAPAPREKSSGSTVAKPAVTSTKEPAPAAVASVPPTPAPEPPKPPEVPANREDVQGNVYTNYTHGFRMYKAPSWSLLEDPRSVLPNAIVAMGTANESALMVVGQENTKEPLEASAKIVEKRLHEVYEKYQLVSQRKTAIGGLPAFEFHFQGSADEHMWSGTLAVVGRGSDIFTVLGMTHADTDLIQIQENVIARAIASLDFSSH